MGFGLGKGERLITTSSSLIPARRESRSSSDDLPCSPSMGAAKAAATKESRNSNTAALNRYDTGFVLLLRSALAMVKAKEKEG